MVFKGGFPQTSNISISQDLVGNADSQAHPTATESETLGWEPAVCSLTNLPRDTSH